MQIGTGLLTAQRRRDESRPTSEIYAELLNLARATEEAGLDSIWVSEHHFSDDGYLPGTMPTLAAIAGVTDTIELGTYIAIAPLYGPVRLAEDAATVDLLSDGRFTLGLGLGYRESEFENFGVPYQERADRLEDTIHLVKGAWTPGPIDHDSSFHDASPKAEVIPKPAQDPHPRIMLGAMAKPAVRRAALYGQGWAAIGNMSFEALKTRKDHIDAVRKEHGLDDDYTIYVAKYGFIDESAEVAWDKIKDGYLHMQRKYAEWATGEKVDSLADEQIADVKDDVLLGSPTEILAELKKYQEALGDDIHVMFRTYYPGIGTDKMTDCIDTLGDEVVPELR